MAFPSSTNLPPADAVAFPTLDNPVPPIPSADLSTQILGDPASAGPFLYGGFLVAEGIRRVLELIGQPLELFRDVLDFGCGTSRVLRWFWRYSTRCRFRGADISREAIEWNRANMPFGEFVANDVEPPLPFADGSFDLVYGISVVTHLGEHLQLAWLAELARILRPGGIAMLTVMGDELAEWKLSPEECAAFRQKGHAYKKVQEGGLHGLPDFYQDAYHSRSYVAREWSRDFELRAYIRNGPVYLQDLVILQKPAAAATSWECLDLQLPIGAIDRPKTAEVLTACSLRVSGWAFAHHVPPVALELAIDRRPMGSCVADESSPAVANVYPTFPEAASCGFSAVLPLEGFQAGAHVLEISAAGQQLPALFSYFFLA